MDPSSADLDFNDGRRVAAKRELQRDAAAPASRQRLSPICLLGRQREHGERSRVDGVRLAVEKRILLRGVGEFIDETLDDEDVVGQTDAAPEGGLNPRRLDADILDPHIRKHVGRFFRAVDHVELEAVLERWRNVAGHDGGAGDAMGPGDRVTTPVEAGRHAVVVVGPVHRVADVFFATPDDLDRTVHVSRDLDGERRAVGLEATAKATPEKMVVDSDRALR